MAASRDADASTAKRADVRAAPDAARREVRAELSARRRAASARAAAAVHADAAAEPVETAMDARAAAASRARARRRSCVCVSDDDVERSGSGSGGGGGRAKRGDSLRPPLSLSLSLSSHPLRHRRAQLDQSRGSPGTCGLQGGAAGRRRGRPAGTGRAQGGHCAAAGAGGGRGGGGPALRHGRGGAASPSGTAGVRRWEARGMERAWERAKGGPACALLPSPLFCALDANARSLARPRPLLTLQTWPGPRADGTSTRGVLPIHHLHTHTHVPPFSLSNGRVDRPPPGGRRGRGRRGHAARRVCAAAVVSTVPAGITPAEFGLSLDGRTPASPYHSSLCVPAGSGHAGGVGRRRVVVLGVRGGRR